MPWEGLNWIGLGVLCYAIGGIPTAYLVTRAMLGTDIRALGDNNSGAANVFRSVGPKAGMAVGAIDIVKGGIAVIVAKALVDHTGMEMMAGVAAVAGHNWPAHLRFRGGRGAATAVGVLIATLPLVSLPVGAVSLVFLYFTRKAMVPLAIFLIAVPVLSWLVRYPPELAVYAVAVPVMVGLSHVLSTRVLAPRPAEGGGGASHSPLPLE